MRICCVCLSSLLLLNLLGCANENPKGEKPETPEAPAVTVEENLHRPLTKEEAAQGWIQLFDGESLFGWQPTNDVDWRVEKGTIIATTGEPGFLQTTSQFANYELKCDCWVAEGGNSGLFLRTPLKPEDPAVDCLEFNLCDTHEQFATASLVARQQPSKKVENDGVWVSYHIIVNGNEVTASVDGEPVLSYSLEGSDMPASGHIGLQFREGAVKFRNIVLKPLGTEPLFNGTDLTGWRVVPEGKSEFTVEEETIHVSNGRGYLESEGTWADFVLQAEIFSNGDHLNSGIFFRAMPAPTADQMNGYEAQVRNEWNGEDRNDPVDFGTGGIYRRVKTRRVVSSDREWFTMTVIAQGAHIAVWVDGFPVTDWTDDRKPNENPREGLRTEAGHLSLQGHDPTTDLSFRNLRIAEWPAR